MNGKLLTGVGLIVFALWVLSIRPGSVLHLVILVVGVVLLVLGIQDRRKARDAHQDEKP